MDALTLAGGKWQGCMYVWTSRGHVLWWHWKVCSKFDEHYRFDSWYSWVGLFNHSKRKKILIWLLVTCVTRLSFWNLKWQSLWFTIINYLTIPNPIQWLKFFMELKIPTIRQWKTLLKYDNVFITNFCYNVMTMLEFLCQWDLWSKCEVHMFLDRHFNMLILPSSITMSCIWNSTPKTPYKSMKLIPKQPRNKSILLRKVVPKWSRSFFN